MIFTIAIRRLADRCPPGRSLEKRFPVLLREFTIRTGSGGIGANNGGNGVHREFEFLMPDMHVSRLPPSRALKLGADVPAPSRTGHGHWRATGKPAVRHAWRRGRRTRMQLLGAQHLGRRTAENQVEAFAEVRVSVHTLLRSKRHQADPES